MAINNIENEDSKPVRITQKEIYEVVTRMEKELITLSSVAKKVDDHETRIRDLEKTVWRSSWITGVVTAVMTSGATAIIIQSLS